MKKASLPFKLKEIVAEKGEVAIKGIVKTIIDMTPKNNNNYFAIKSLL